MSGPIEVYRQIMKVKRSIIQIKTNHRSPSAFTGGIPSPPVLQGPLTKRVRPGVARGSLPSTQGDEFESRICTKGRYVIVSKVFKGQWMAILALLWCQERKQRCFHALLQAFLASLREGPTTAVSKRFLAPMAFVPPPENVQGYSPHAIAAAADEARLSAVSARSCPHAKWCPLVSSETLPLP